MILIPKETTLAASIGVTLLFQPGVGAIQAAMATVLVVGLARALSLQADRELPHQAWWKRIALASVWCLMPSFVLLVQWLWLEQRDYGDYEPQMYLVPFWLLTTAIAIAALVQTLRGRASFTGLLQGVLVGLLMSAVWVVVGAALRMTDVLRFHPYATLAVALAGLALMTRDTLRRRGATVFRFWVFVWALAIGLYVYSGIAASDSPAKLGYLASELSWTSPQGRFTANAEERDGHTMIFVRDSNCRQQIYLKTIYGTYAGLEFDREGDMLLVRWFEPQSFWYGPSPTNTLRRFIKTQKAQVVSRDLATICTPLMGRR